MKPIHWRRTKLGKYLRHLPRRKHIKGTMVHRLFGDRLFDSELWHPTRQRFASGIALGAFFALMPPLPFQMLGAGIIAYITRVNVPAAMTGTWISNPFTTPFIVYLQYRLGCFMMGRDPIHIADGQLLSSLAAAPLPYMLGIVWDGIFSRIEAAKKRKALHALRDALPKKLLETAEPDGH
jgi:uncharacterized protein (DUF2062 family)